MCVLTYAFLFAFAFSCVARVELTGYVDTYLTQTHTSPKIVPNTSKHITERETTTLSLHTHTQTKHTGLDKTQSRSSSNLYSQTLTHKITVITHPRG